MNSLEKIMVEHLIEMKENHSVTAVKLEFEAEGTRMEEAMRLKEIASKAGLDLVVKIGGCEAMKDMYEAASLGTKYMVAPMVESPFALSKYVEAVNTAFSVDQRDDMEFFINIETVTAVEKFDAMLETEEIKQLTGIVIGRHDLVSSMGIPLDQINGERVLGICMDVARRAKHKGLKVVVGGAVSAQSRDFFHSFPKGHLDKFETRKIVFGCPGALENGPESYLKAVEFEINWLKNKKLYYGNIHKEGENRLAVMEARYNASIQKLRAGG
ncbi:MAG TPA: aldolase/citrate lyase family protein [Fibrobacteria bacterium]|nr:aldolase/citrate lyase family protein [Fibrobacteria bacterium]HOX49930.1 aldolase/citrate lyase family protein [Fibrobacteria bacterium]